MSTFPESCLPPRDGPSESLIWMIFGAADEIAPHLANQILLKGDRLFVVECLDSCDNPAEINLATVSLSGLAGPVVEARACIQGAPFMGGEAIVQELLHRCASIFGSLPHVIVNLDERGVTGPCETQQEHELRGTLAANFGRMFVVCRSALAAWKHQGHVDKRVIINKSGIMGILGAPGLGSFCASQFAIEGYTETLALETEADGVCVMILESGVLHERTSNPIATLLQTNPVVSASPCVSTTHSPASIHSPTASIHSPVASNHSPHTPHISSAPTHQSPTIPNQTFSPSLNHVSSPGTGMGPLSTLLATPQPAIHDRQLSPAYQDSAAVYGNLIAQQLRDKNHLMHNSTYVPCQKPRIEDEPVREKKRKASAFDEDAKFVQDQPPGHVHEVTFVDLLAATVWEAAHCGRPPLRLTLGRQAVKLYKEKLRLSVEEIEDWKYLYGHWEE